MSKCTINVKRLEWSQEIISTNLDFSSDIMLMILVFSEEGLNIPDFTQTSLSRSWTEFINFESGSSNLHISKAYSLSAIVHTYTSKRLRPLAIK
jgi:hypothetical protein